MRKSQTLAFHIFLLLLLPVVLSCRTTAPASAVAVAADAQDLQVLAGEWWGEYSSADTGRNGRIRFRLEPGDELARGDVLMLQKHDHEDTEAPEAQNLASTGSNLLTIRFVRVSPESEKVTGILDPYEDPECGCIVTTTFEGEVRDEKIVGTFVTVGPPAHQTQRGRWRVDRKSPTEETEQP